MLENKRDLFTIPDDIAYFNCAYMSPLSIKVTEAGQKAVLQKANPWQVTPQDFFDDSEVAKDLFAHLISADKSDISIIPSASYGLAIAAKNTPLENGDKILVLQDQFPSNVYCWQQRAAETGAIIETVPAPADKDWTKAVLSKIDSSVAVAALPNNHWADGGILDLVEIKHALEAVDAKLVLDVTQSLGVLPLTVKEVKPDFLVVAAYKWLMGPYSIGFLYASPENQQGEPIEYNWLNRAGSEDFAGLVNYEDNYQSGAARYDMGQRANFQLLPMAIAALNQILDWSVPEIYETIGHLNRKIANAAQDLNLTILPEKLRAQHFLSIEKTGGFAPDLLQKMAAENIFLSMRGNSLRITPHVYNTDQDCQKLIDALADFTR